MVNFSTNRVNTNNRMNMLKSSNFNIHLPANNSGNNSYQDYEEIDYSQEPQVEYEYTPRIRRFSDLYENEEVKRNISNLLNVDYNNIYFPIVESNYPIFSLLLTGDFIDMGDLGDYVPQGVCSAHGNTLVSMYTEDDNSIIRVIGPDGSYRDVKLALPNGTHVGGIAYDPENDNVWVCGDKGSVVCYSYSDIVNSDGTTPLECKARYETGLRNANGDLAASYLTYEGGHLYVGTFNESSKGDVTRYDVDGTVLTADTTFHTPKKTQGISFYERDGVRYKAISKSYGRNNDSTLVLQVWNPDEGRYVTVNEVNCPPMLEQVTFNEDGTLTCVFESNAKKYNNGKHQIGQVCVIDPFTKIE